MKTCSKCGEVKSLADFHRRKDSADGLRSYCKKCCIASVSAWQSSNYEKRLGYARKSAQKYRTESPEKHRESVRKWAAANPALVANKQARRASALIKATPHWADQSRIREVYDFAQEFKDAGFDVHVDHIEPLRGETVCGLHVEHNLRVCLADANRSKSNRQMEHFQ